MNSCPTVIEFVSWGFWLLILYWCQLNNYLSVLQLCEPMCVIDNGFIFALRIWCGVMHFVNGTEIGRFWLKMTTTPTALDQTTQRLNITAYSNPSHGQHLMISVSFVLYVCIFGYSLSFTNNSPKISNPPADLFFFRNGEKKYDRSDKCLWCTFSFSLSPSILAISLQPQHHQLGPFINGFLSCQ